MILYKEDNAHGEKTSSLKVNGGAWSVDVRKEDDKRQNQCWGTFLIRVYSETTKEVIYYTHI